MIENHQAYLEVQLFLPYLRNWDYFKGRRNQFQSVDILYTTEQQYEKSFVYWDLFIYLKRFARCETGRVTSFEHKQ